MPIRIKIFVYFTKLTLLKFIAETFLDRTEKNRDIKYLVLIRLFFFYVSSIPILYHLRAAVKGLFSGRFYWEKIKIYAIIINRFFKEFILYFYGKHQR